MTCRLAGCNHCHTALVAAVGRQLSGVCGCIFCCLCCPLLHEKTSCPPLPSPARLPVCLCLFVGRQYVCLLVGPNEFILQKWKVYVLGSYTWWLCIRFGWMSTAGDLCQWRTKNRSGTIATAPNEDASLGVNSRGLFICLHWEFCSKGIHFPLI